MQAGDTNGGRTSWFNATSINFLWLPIRFGHVTAILQTNSGLDMLQRTPRPDMLQYTVHLLSKKSIPCAVNARGVAQFTLAERIRDPPQRSKGKSSHVFTNRGWMRRAVWVQHLMRHRTLDFGERISVRVAFPPSTNRPG